ncbi:hypothetical protein F6Y05_37450 [Bacillus megaterium]|nr:hypothetical protein [Priestia megaterium]
MLIKKIISELSNTDLAKAFTEIEEWKNTGKLNQSGTFNSIHSEFEEKVRRGTESQSYRKCNII